MNCDKIAETLTEYKPKWTVPLGAEQLYNAYKEVGLRLDEFEGPRYRRIHHIQQLIDNGYLSNELRWLKPEFAD